MMTYYSQDLHGNLDSEISGKSKIGRSGTSGNREIGKSGNREIGKSGIGLVRDEGRERAGQRIGFQEGNGSMDR